MDDRLTDEERDFVAANLGLAAKFAILANAGRDADDSFHDGVFGLARAARKFDPSRGIAFSTYAASWIRHFIARAKHADALIRTPINLADGRRSNPALVAAADRVEMVSSLSGRWDGDGSDVGIAAPVVEPEWDFEEVDRIRRLLSRLPERTRDVILRRTNDETFVSIGRLHGITGYKAKSIYLAGLASLRREWKRDVARQCDPSARES